MELIKHTNEYFPTNRVFWLGKSSSINVELSSKPCSMTLEGSLFDHQTWDHNIRIFIGLFPSNMIALCVCQQCVRNGVDPELW